MSAFRGLRFRISAPAFWGLLFFALAAGVWWTPVLQTFSTMVPGLGGDAFQTLWRTVRLGDALSRGTLTIAEEHVVRNFGPLPWLPLSAVFGEVAMYNLAWFLSAVFSGWFTFLLARRLGSPLFPSLLAGLLVEFSPYRLSQALGHFGSLQVWWIPATLLAAANWARRRSVPWGLATAAGIVGTAWTEHQLFISLLLFLVVLGGVFWRDVLALLRRARLSVALAGVLVFLGAILPFLSTVSITSSAESFLNLGPAQRERFSATAQTLLLPPPFHLFRRGISGYGTDTATVADHVHTLGATLLAVTIVTLLRPPRVRRKHAALAVAAGAGILLSLGPVLRLSGTAIPLPGALFDILPVVSALRTMGRFVVVAVVALPVLLALRWTSLPGSLLLRLLVAGLLLLEIVPAWGYPRLEAVSPDISRALTTAPAGGLLVIPSLTNSRLASEYLYLSARLPHALPGNSALDRATDPAARARFLATPVVRDLALLRLQDLSLPTFFGQDLAAVAPAAFASFNIRAVVLHADPQGGVYALAGSTPERITVADVERARRFLQDTLGLTEESLGKNVYLFRVRLPNSQDENVVAMKGEGWELDRRTADELVTTVSGRAAVLTYVAAPPTRAVELVADVVSRDGAERVSVSGPSVDTVVVVPSAGVIQIPLGALPQGVFSTTLQVAPGRLMLRNPRLREAR